MSKEQIIRRFAGTFVLLSLALGYFVHPAWYLFTAFVGANLLYLKGGTKDHFMGFLQQQFPHLVASYNRLYAGAYAKSEYVKAVRGMIDVLQQRYDVRRRRSRDEESVAEDADTVEEEKAAPQQAALSWES